MPDLFIILFVVGVFLGAFYLVSVVRERRPLHREPEERPDGRKAA